MEQGDARKIPVDNMQFKGNPYEVAFYKKIADKVMSSEPLIPEKMAILNNIVEVVKTSIL